LCCSDDVKVNYRGSPKPKSTTGEVQSHVREGKENTGQHATPTETH